MNAQYADDTQNVRYNIFIINSSILNLKAKSLIVQNKFKPIKA